MSDFEVTFIDVGHGDSTLIKLPGDGFVLVDVYRCPDQGIDLFKLLDDVLPDGNHGKKRLDVLAITHAHDDHITGIGDLYDRYEVVELWLPQHGEKLGIPGKNYEEFERVRDAHPEDQKEWPKGSRSVWRTLGANDEVAVRCFSPPGYINPEEALDEEEAKRKVHENCVVLRFSYAGYSVILTGDSNKPCWERIVGYYEGRTDDVGVEVLRGEALHASHHGSRTFVKDERDDKNPFLRSLELIEPEEVIISVGPDSRHDHPHEDMVDIYNDQAGSKHVLQTCEVGTMRLEVDADGVAQLITNDSAIYQQSYRWDDDDGPDGGERAKHRPRPPGPPPPDYEGVQQRAPRRDRYGL